jgi:hypothetical protein
MRALPIPFSSGSKTSFTAFQLPGEIVMTCL